MQKKISALVACMNTGMIGYAIGDYAGMVPRIQYQLADQTHEVLLGNVYLFIGMAITTFFCWPLPLLHGRRPYILASLGLAVPLQFPQAIFVSQARPPAVFGYEFGLLSCRFLTGLLLGLTNINDFAILLDCFGASLQSEYPHQEFVANNDVRREGDGIGIWLGIWAWCWVGSVSVGFMSGAGIINSLNPQWGFYISVGLMICVLIFNIMASETRHSSLRRTLRKLKHDGKCDEHHQRKVARGEIKLHLEDKGPRYWFQELWAGIVLMKRMFFQRGFSVISLYLGWMYGQNILVIILLGALLSRDYRLRSRYVGLGVCSVAIGALLAVPMSYAGLFSCARKTGPRTDT
jgi:general stress protein CsbA